jgi:hypothetical protein
MGGKTKEGKTQTQKDKGNIDAKRQKEIETQKDKGRQETQR